MLPLTQRLKRAGLFTRAYSTKKLVTTPIFTLYVLPRQEKATKTNAVPKRILPMIGFVVSKKVCKSACGRNKMKRRVREAYRRVSTGGGENTGTGRSGPEVYKLSPAGLPLKQQPKLHRPLQGTEPVEARQPVGARFTEPVVGQDKDFSVVRQSLSKWYAIVVVIKEGALKAAWSDVCETMEKAFLEAARRYG